MNEITLSIKELVGSKAIENSEGEKIRILISNHIKRGNNVVVDFKGVTSILSLFLNPAIGDLYGDFSEEQVKNQLRIENLPPEYIETFKRVVDRAKEFYKDKETISSVIDGKLDKQNENN